jgi:hypothetical protein
MVMVSALIAIVMKYATISVKQTKNTLLKEQAELFLRSSIELAILGLQGMDKNTPLKKIKIISHDDKFIANINIKKYFLFEHNSTNLIQEIKSEELSGMVLMEIEVVSNTSNPKVDEQIRIVKKTLQRP